MPVALQVKNPPISAGDATDMGSIPGLGRSPEKGMATHSSILAWRIPWQSSLVMFTDIHLIHIWPNSSCFLKLFGKTLVVLDSCLAICPDNIFQINFM